MSTNRPFSIAVLDCHSGNELVIFIVVWFETLRLTHKDLEWCFYWGTYKQQCFLGYTKSHLAWWFFFNLRDENPTFRGWTNQVEKICLSEIQDLPSGKRLHSNGKIHHFNGKIHYKWPFSIAMLNYQRVFKTYLVLSENRVYSQL